MISNELIDRFKNDKVILKLHKDELPEFCKFIENECKINIATKYILEMLSFPKQIAWCFYLKNNNQAIIIDNDKNLVPTWGHEVIDIEKYQSCQITDFLTLI